MSVLNLNIPVLVRNVSLGAKTHYHIRPLFEQYPVVTKRRYEEAISKFKEEFRLDFQGFELTRQSSDALLWYRFNPEVKYEIFDLEITTGKQYYRGQFSAAFFNLAGKRFALLPHFRDYMFMLEPDEKGKYQEKEAIVDVIHKLVRKYKKESDDNKIDLSEYEATKGEFLTEIKSNLKVKTGQFSFEQQNQWNFFSGFSDQSNFVGGVEIEKVGKDLNRMYPSDLKSAYYREALVERLLSLMYSKDNTPVVLVGADGVGKRSILQEAVYRYIGRHKTENVEHLQKVWYIDPTRIIAGMSIVGMWQKRFEAILKFLIQRRKELKHWDGATDIVLIENVVAMLRIGKSAQNDMTLSDVLKPYLEKRMLGTVIIATPEEWKILQEKDRRFADLFQVIRVNEPKPADAIKMVLQQRKILELEQSCQITTHAIRSLFVIQRNYLKQKALPGSVMKMLNQLATQHKFNVVDEPEVQESFKNYSRLQSDIFDDKYAFQPNEVSAKIKQQLIGQPAAVEALTEVVHTIKAKLSTPGKPLASFLFIGPTGVGKTQAAKVLCDYLLQSESKLMRFDMNEFIDYTAVSRLIGDYYNPEGQLTGKVRYNPFGIVLFDEIEKAHPNVHDLLLQVLDDGRLTDSVGRTVDFSNTIIIMTSNVGANDVSSSLGFAQKQDNIAAIYQKAVENKFRPEFVNRIDKIVVFNPLELEHIENIARLQINDLLSRDGFVRRTTILNISQEAIKWVARRGFDSKMGGRALKRQIEKDLTSLSAEQLISTHTDRPIIFDIIFENGELRPNITTLDFVEALDEDWLPDFPDENKGGRYFGALLKEVESLEKRIFRKEEKDESYVAAISISGDEKIDWQSYWFKDKIQESKGNLRDVIAGFREKHFKGGPAIPFRLKGGGLAYYSEKKHKETTKDILFQKEGLEEVNEYYRLTSMQFDSIRSEYIDYFVNVQLLQLFAKGFLEGETEILTLNIKSCITNQGKDAIGYILENYKSLLELLDVSAEILPTKNGLRIEGHNLTELLEGEVGFHLFYLPHQNPIPIRVELKNEQTQVTHLAQKVLRLYDMNATLTDLRTGLTNEINISSQELKLLVYAGIKTR